MLNLPEAELSSADRLFFQVRPCFHGDAPHFLRVLQCLCTPFVMKDTIVVLVLEPAERHVEATEHPYCTHP